MGKVLLFLYPVFEYTNIFLFHKDSLYDDWHVPRPLPIMNEAIDKRYRQKGYEVIFALYSNRDIYGLTLYPEDRVIDVGIPFPIEERKIIESKDESTFYPNLDNLCRQVGFANQMDLTCSISSFRIFSNRIL